MDGQDEISGSNWRRFRGGTACDFEKRPERCSSSARSLEEVGGPIGADGVEYSSDIPLSIRTIQGGHRRQDHHLVLTSLPTQSASGTGRAH
ncbi:hypothetical protein MARPO_0075s0003 [Marchantia polymorpha]|uniref:Uncharacterized protein n=1 Tax=Marchantia polymorpha TaxID=3197 RepID=A0A2R6WLZ2_MARPO|nr:hypothetical protein MARPO_0075s0003 [Marchantia polymorpha]|eukprot:PTQ34874.1 hypothetical protein MARPO_0075s0003 [Marchantia polymorpha]